MLIIVLIIGIVANLLFICYMKQKPHYHYANNLKKKVNIFSDNFEGRMNFRVKILAADIGDFCDALSKCNRIDTLQIEYYIKVIDRKVNTLKELGYED